MYVFLLLLFSFAKCALAHPPIPAGATLVEKGDYYVTYTTKDGEKRIIFSANSAVVAPGLRVDVPNNSLATEVILVTHKGRVVPYVTHGKHRTVGAALFDQIPQNLGGTSSSGWLDYKLLGKLEKAPTELVEVSDLANKERQRREQVAKAERDARIALEAQKMARDMIRRSYDYSYPCADPFGSVRRLW